VAMALWTVVASCSCSCSCALRGLISHFAMPFCKIIESKDFSQINQGERKLH
jgi:hypothetical protein